VSGPHGDHLYVHGHSAIHDAAPECKLLAQILFAFAVVATPREAFWALGLDALLVLVLLAAAELSPRTIASRLWIEIPFVTFALLMPWMGSGPQVQIGGVWMYEAGLWSAWNILAKGTLGVLTAILIAATTPQAELLRGLSRLGLPDAFTQILTFMIRYFDVVAAESQRMRVARQSRGYDPRWLWQARAIATSAGALFVRSYERGERVYLAMLSRGYTGALPASDASSASVAQWGAALAFPIVAALLAGIAWNARP